MDPKSAALRATDLSTTFYLGLLDQVNPNNQELLTLIEQQVQLIELLRQGLVNDAPEDQLIERGQIIRNAERLLLIWPRSQS